VELKPRLNEKKTSQQETNMLVKSVEENDSVETWLQNILAPRWSWEVMGETFH
jgi:hypothetical protein